MRLDKQTRKKQQRGIAMVMALLALLILAVIGMGFIFMSTTETSANRNYKDSQKAYFASRAGLETVRTLLAQNPNLKNAVSLLSMPLPAPNNTGIIYVYNSDGATAIDPSGAANPATADTELCQEQYANLLATLPPPVQQGVPCVAVAPPPGIYQWAAVPNGNNPPIPLRTAAQVPGGDIPNTNTPSALPFQWVRITNKQNLMGLVQGGQQFVDPTTPIAGNQVCWDGQREYQTAPGNCPNISSTLAGKMYPVWLLTSLAVTPGGSHRMTQMEVAFTPPINPDATITAEAPITTHGSLVVNGFDNCTCTKTGTTLVPGIGCVNTHHAISTPNGITVQGGPSETVTAGPNPPTNPNFNPWPYDIPGLINMFVQAGAVDVTGIPYNVSCSNTCGTISGQQFGNYPTSLPAEPTNFTGNQNTYIPGSVRLDGSVTGAGVLIINGDLDVHGGFDFYGLVLVKGKITFSGGGPQSVNLYGAILAGEDIGVSDSIGGSFNFHYDTCALNFSAPPGPPRMLASHELMF